MTASHDDVLREQITYYRARASEYDEWFLRQGRYDHGVEENARWQAEVAETATSLDVFLAERANARGGATLSALEFAAGTGLWTQRLRERCVHLTALDASPEALAINRARLGAHDDTVTYEVANLFTWQPTRRYDVVFFSFWLSHVPPERFAAFWSLVSECLAPDGRVFLVDSRFALTSSAHDHHLEGPDATTLTRRLNDGREYRIVKVFYTPERLRADLAALGWRADIRATPTYFLSGQVAPAAQSG